MLAKKLTVRIPNVLLDFIRFYIYQIYSLFIIIFLLCGLGTESSSFFAIFGSGATQSSKQSNKEKPDFTDEENSGNETGNTSKIKLFKLANWLFISLVNANSLR